MVAVHVGGYNRWCQYPILSSRYDDAVQRGYFAPLCDLCRKKFVWCTLPVMGTNWQACQRQVGNACNRTRSRHSWRRFRRHQVNFTKRHRAGAVRHCRLPLPRSGITPLHGFNNIQFPVVFNTTDFTGWARGHIFFSQTLRVFVAPGLSVSTGDSNLKLTLSLNLGPSHPSPNCGDPVKMSA